MSVRRFENWCLASHGHNMAERDTGRFVLYEDYAALEKELAECKRSYVEGLEAWRKNSHHHADLLIKLQQEITDLKRGQS